MNIKNLELMITMLEEVKAGTWKPQKKALDLLKDEVSIIRMGVKSSFDMGLWAAPTEKLSCGYTACALGHATLDKRFRKLGLEGQGASYLPVFKEYEGYEAAMEMFDLEDLETAEVLFGPTSYPKLKEEQTIEQVIRRIKKLMQIGETKFVNHFTENTHKVMLYPSLRYHYL